MLFGKIRRNAVVVHDSTTSTGRIDGEAGRERERKGNVPPSPSKRILSVGLTGAPVSECQFMADGGADGKVASVPLGGQ